MHKLNRFIIILICCLVQACPRAAAQDNDSTLVQPRYQFRLDSTSIMLGDQTVLSIAKAPVYPSLDALSNNDIVAVRQWFDTTDGTLYTALTSFEPGEHWLHVGDDSILLTVNDVANVDTTSAEIRDIAGIMKQPYTFGEIARVLLCFWVFWAALAAGVLIYIRVKKHKPIISLPQAPPIPADTRALQRLEALRQRQLWQQGMVKEYYTEMTDTVREYLEESYNIHSTEMTSDQTIDAFRQAPVCTEENASLLGQILRAADMVKFAKSMPQPYQHDMALNQSSLFIKNTAALNPGPEASDNGDKAPATNTAES